MGNLSGDGFSLTPNHNVNEVIHYETVSIEELAMSFSTRTKTQEFVNKSFNRWFS